jgi:hypothetical protein
MKKLTIAINKLLTKGLIEMGATKVVDPIFESYSIQTTCGELVVHLPRPESCKYNKGKYTIVSCYSCFKDVALAKTKVDCNPWSGKWNWVHFASDFTPPESFADYVLNQIRKILPDFD